MTRTQITTECINTIRWHLKELLRYKNKHGVDDYLKRRYAEMNGIIYGFFSAMFIDMNVYCYYSNILYQIEGFGRIESYYERKSRV